MAGIPIIRAGQAPRIGSKLPILRAGSGGGGIITPPPASGLLYDQLVATSQPVLNIYPELWPQGTITQSMFNAQTPFDSGHWKSTPPERFSRAFQPAVGKDMIFFQDHDFLTHGTNNPWLVRVIPEIAWGATKLVPGVGATPGEWALSEFELYFPRHEYTGTNQEGWNPGFTIKWVDGWDLGGVGATGQNPQTQNDVCEIVFTSYGIKTLQNNSYDLNSKGDFGKWQTGQTTIDVSGTRHPVLDINNFEHYSNYFMLGWGIYAKDPRQDYPFQNMLYPTYEGTNHRVIFKTEQLINIRTAAKLNSSGQRDGEFYCDISLDGGPRWVGRHLTDVDWRGTGVAKWLDNGLGFFPGGGNGSVFGTNQYHPFPRPPYYSRRFCIGYKRNFIRGLAA